MSETTNPGRRFPCGGGDSGGILNFRAPEMLVAARVLYVHVEVSSYVTQDLIDAF